MVVKRVPLFFFILHQFGLGACDREGQLARGPNLKSGPLIWKGSSSGAHFCCVSYSGKLPDP